MSLGDSENNLILSRCGTLLMLLATALAMAIFVDHWTDLKVSFPSFWYTSRSLHPLLCTGLFLGGWYCHRASSPGLLPRRGKVVFDEVTVYTGDMCPLCDQAMAVLSDYARWLPPINEVNIRGDEELMAKFGRSIPVVEMDGVLQFQGRINRETLERLIKSRQNQTSSVVVRESQDGDR